MLSLSIQGWQAASQYWIKILHPWVQQKFYPVLGRRSGGRLLEHCQTPALRRPKSIHQCCAKRSPTNTLKPLWCMCIFLLCPLKTSFWVYTKPLLCLLRHLSFRAENTFGTYFFPSEVLCWINFGLRLATLLTSYRWDMCPKLKMTEK